MRTLERARGAVLLWGVALALAACFLAGVAAAQDASPAAPSSMHDRAIDAADQREEPPGYRVIVAEAIVEYNAHNFAEAHSLFAKAHAEFPNARTLRGLGMVEFELKRYRECIAHLQQALDSDIKSLDEVLRVKAEELLTRARNFVASVRVEVEPLPAQIVVDGEPTAVRGRTELLLRVGDHVLEFRAPGHYVERRELQLSGGEAKTVHVILTRQIEFAPAAPRHTERKSLRKNGWFWSGVALLAAGAAVATTLTLRDRTARPDLGSTHSSVGP